MTTRLLPEREWWKLDATEARDVWRSFSPDHVEVIVVEDAGRIVGLVTLLSVLHAECVEIAREHRGKAAVGRLLLQALTERVQAAHGTAVWASAIDDRMARILSSLGSPVPSAEHFVLPLVKESVCLLS